MGLSGSQESRGDPREQGEEWKLTFPEYNAIVSQKVKEASCAQTERRDVDVTSG